MAVFLGFCISFTYNTFCYIIFFMESLNNSIVLMGCKHCGKTTHGKKLAADLGVDFFDTDEVMEKMIGKSVRDFYRENGVSAFMEAEEAACDKIIEENKDKMIVVSTGGGICDNAPAITKLRIFQKFVFLRLDIEYSIKRVAAGIKMLNPGQFQNAPAYILAENPKSMQDVNNILTRKYTERFNQYQSMADIIIDVKNAPIEENYKLIKEALV